MNERPVALITGASSGFGALTAARFREHGFQVFGTRRAGGAGFLSLDVDSDASVRACLDALSRQTERIDVLVNNAGRAMVGACEETSAEEARALFETNVFGVMRVTNAVLPVMRARGAGRIINVGSVSGFVGVPFHGAYAASKHALAGYTEALRVEVAPMGVEVALVEPSAHRTGIQMLRPRELLSLYDEGRERVESIIRRQIETGDDPGRVSDAILRAATERAPTARYRVGGKAVFAAFARRVLSLRAFERVLVREFDPR
ncbi:SDR family NAD(P)-dependent oxidoreductase [Myxococcus sp. K15C18031901]|uniref:SDR family NAD(P)-dependent oxidoreductase n=1 Tax=Myxococcus dinghuensis TaxID=2906761 RepID=UPI0020A74A7A|nr:SDR family NAD(P)-dependent oxidoreductase [Myxococcus dinghuensis]MCP3102037.1 SDR family NAD(P)-dependent oxidoreductase [Myxococcus dinghuensis]